MNRTCSPDSQLWVHFVEGNKDSSNGSSSSTVAKQDWTLYDIYRLGESLPLSEAAKNLKLMRQIQIRLIMLGALPRTATADGLYGPITRGAIDRFARGFGIPSDPITREWAEKMIEANEIPGLNQVDYLISPEIVAKATLAPLSDVNKYYPSVAAALEEKGIHNMPTLIAAIATIGVETGGFQTINEYGGTSYFTRMYEGRTDLGNTEPGDGARFHGRGFIQITGRANYREYGKALGVDLENNPDLALDPDVGAKVIAQYFWDRQIDILAKQGDWKGVRRAVNGGLNGWDVFWEIVRYLRGRI
ncbi:MAG: hypothetical protein F6J93_39070 [Oscillatoria sp. SIO1A7]|nr:hypothetical protein [Oscillatoria sp. SIO1A7]